MIDRHQKHAKHQKGAVSLFVVIFTALLVTTITVSFLQLMVRDQQQAMYSDLSESAYDSAVAGVEDAKRVLLAHRECGDSDSERCVDIRSAIEAEECTTLAHLVGGDEAETLIQQEQSGSDDLLDQAYTCVTITPNTSDYLGSFDSANTATLIPLRATQSFDRIRLSWHQSESGGDVDLPADTSLPPVGAATWPENRPSLMRAQLINGEGHSSFSLSDFDDSGYSNTLFLIPSKNGIPEYSFSGDGRREDRSSPLRARCEERVESGAYACTVTLITNSEIPAGRETVFLNLVAFYNPTDYKIELLDGNRPVTLSGVQPEVDSTGRANDLFRRVVSRVEIGNTFNYPVAALETSGNLCKSFSVTTDPRDYDGTNTCEP